ncbi:hypothetical protein KEM54_005240 [Ascosphaera aggregata]|nr:hypothetical protein KEM54_005240 [Ascosphaera aggregata]
MSLPNQSIVPPPVGISGLLVNSINDLPKEQVDAIIRTKRKAREPKACYPCHTRKVKCDRKLPCEGCVKRDHTDLCTYERPTKKRQPIFFANSSIELSNKTSTGLESHNHGDPAAAVAERFHDGKEVTVSRHEWDQVCKRLREVERIIASLRDNLESIAPPRPTVPKAPSLDTNITEDSFAHSSTKTEGIHAPNEFGDTTVHLGSRSILAHILGHPGTSQDTTNALLEGGILPKLGLDNDSTTYPFIDLWSSSNPAIFDLDAVCAVLPDDDSCRKYIFFYREVISALYPVMPDMDQFIETADILLQNRRAWSFGSPTAGSFAEKPYGMEMDFLGLIFAVLAAGCLGSNQPGKSLTSQVYGKPTLVAIQAMLIIGSVLSYNMNPGVSYVVQGMTIRMTLVVGLQATSPRFSPQERYKRQCVWWSMAWQDSHFSLSYDRPSSMAFNQPPIPYGPDSRPGRRSYFESLCRLVSLTLKVVRVRMTSQGYHMDFSVIQQYQEEVKGILMDGMPHLRERSLCTTSVQHLERLALKLHCSFISSELCRPSLRPRTKFSEAESDTLRHSCIESLFQTVEAYVELHGISPSASVSWTALQRAISSAFLLIVLGEANTDSPTRQLLRHMEAVLSDKVASESNAVKPDLSTGTAASSPKSVRMMQGPVDSVNNSTGGFDIYWTLMSEKAITPASPLEQAQWTTPLTKTFRTLRKLNAALAKQHGQRYNDNSETSLYDSKSHKTSAFPSMRTAKAFDGAQEPPAPDEHPTKANQGSPFPPTPNSVTSMDTNLTHLLGRASERSPILRTELGDDHFELGKDSESVNSNARLFQIPLRRALNGQPGSSKLLLKYFRVDLKYFRNPFAEGKNLGEPLAGHQSVGIGNFWGFVEHLSTVPFCIESLSWAYLGSQASGTKSANTPNHP